MFNLVETLYNNIFLNIYINDIICIKIGDTMLDQIINNFYFIRLLYLIIIVLIGISVINDLKSKDIAIDKYLNIKKINIGILLKYLFLSFIVRIISEQLVIFIPFKTTDVQIPSNFFELIIEFIISCIFASIFEEIIFRFGLYKVLNKRLNIYNSIIVTSIIFAAIHIYNIDGFTILLGISLIWNYSFYKTNNLIYPILLHFFHNLYALSGNIFDYSNYWYIFLIISIIGYGLSLLKKQKH